MQARPRRRRRLLVSTIAVVVLLVGGLAGGWAYSRAQRGGPLPPLEDKLPEFVEADESLERAPSSAAFGLQVGGISADALLAELEARGLDCDDTGMRAAMARLREIKREQLAATDDPDAVSGASIVYRRSKKENNPQVRLSCELEQLGTLEPGRPAVEGRALFVFDSPEHPLRHASLRRSYSEPEAAMSDLRDSIARLRAIYGEPTSVRSEVPLPGDAPPRIEPISAEWRYRDLLVRATATQYGPVISVDERIEVPWPVRADAPTL